MKRLNKGVTLVSLTIYIILFTITIGVLSTLTGYFMKNIDDVVVSENSDELFNRFLTYIHKDLNDKDLINIKSGQIDSDEDYLIFVFSNNVQHQYIVEKLNNDNTLYFLNKESSGSCNKIIALSKNVTGNSNIFEYGQDNILKINMNINGKLFSTEIQANM